MKIALVDPSIFTPPYDQALGEALIRVGLLVEWFGRAPRSDDPVSTDLIQPVPVFYELTERMRQRWPESVVLMAKAVEHVWQSEKLRKHLVSNSFEVAHFQ